MQKIYALILLLLSAMVLSAGQLAIVSEPAGAEIILNHIRTGRTTPDTLRNLPDKEVTITLLLDQYQFEERTIVPGLDSVVTISFSQIDDFDPLAITADSLFGIIQLPEPPIDFPYLVNEIIEDRSHVILSAGIHHIQWNGDISFKSIDTLIEVRPARIETPEFTFARRYGRLHVVTNPDFAGIEIDGELVGRGDVERPVTAGKHHYTVSFPGWLPKSKTVVLFPGQTVRDTVELEVSPDRDEDGFPDSVDYCPELFGIYDGCPTIQKREEFRKVGRYLGKSFLEAPFTIEFSPVAIQARYATKKGVRELLSLFNDGPALLNNYRGIVLANKVWFSRSIFIGSIEGSYSFAGLKYEKPWEIPLEKDSSLTVLYDRFLNDNPEIAIFSLAVQGGLQLYGERVTFAFLTGYQYETIDIFGLTSYADGDTVKVSQSHENNNWKTSVRATVSLGDEPFLPRLYGEMNFAPGRSSYTGWVETRIGVIIPWWNEK